MKKHFGFFALLAAAFLAFGLLTGCVTIAEDETALAADIPELDGAAADDAQTMTVHFIDVGQGDSIFIDFGDYEILIDAGIQKYGKTVAEYIAPFVDPPIELVIATHPDADHIGGLPDVISTFDIGKILYNGEEKDTATYRSFSETARAKQDCEFSAAADSVYDMGSGASIEIITPVKHYSDVNDNSIVAILRYNDVSVLLTGDMEAKSEKDLLDRFSKVDVLKAAHHGSKTSSSAGFLGIAEPEYVIVSAGVGNRYKHPHLEALERFFSIGATVYGTFKEGTIVMSTDGASYSFTASEALTASDAGDKIE
ncbi:MAG: MBL fold metallo-hydrolase [Clostridiales bacterium]|nr:MBL fold metallo-hydrolase [Clostridiales bacterium]